MRIRYKTTGAESWSNSFNTHALAEVLTGDDSPFIKELDVYIEGIGWKDMMQAFRDKDIVPDNYRQYFGPPVDASSKERGWNP